MRVRRRLLISATLAAGTLGVAEVRGPVHADPPDVVINEFMASNGTTLVDDDGNYSDWIELWNRGDTPADLTGWHLTDSAGNPTKWTFPALDLPADGYLVVFASDDDEAYPLHTNFKLSAGGEYLGLTDTGGTVMSEYAPTFPAQLVDVSYGIGSDATIGFLLHPTPGGPNEVAGSGVAATPVLSHEGGWIDAPVQVTAASSTPGATLVYTTDGSLPSATNGSEYTTPIDVTGSSMLRVVAVRDDWFDSQPASATFYAIDEVLAQVGQPAGWPGGPVNSQVFDYGFVPGLSPAEVAEVEAALLAAPVMNVQADQAHFTDPATGIYTHSRESGSAWERPVSVDFIDPAGGESFHRAAGIRIKGGSSRAPSNPKHSFRLTFGPQYSGLLTHPLFGPTGIQTFASVDLRSEQNFSWHRGSNRNTMLRDVWLRDSQAAIGHPATRSRWTHLFLNGQYWGLYMLTERVGEVDAAQRFGGTANDYDVLKHGDQYEYEVEDGDDDQWTELWDAVANGHLTDAEYSLVSTLVDLPNLVDSRIVDIVAGNMDSAPSSPLGDLRANNWFAVGSDDMPFQFFLHDGEHTLGAPNHLVTVDRTGPFPLGNANPMWHAKNFNPGWLHGVLLTRADYRVLVRQRVAALLAPDGPLGTTPSLARWNARQAEVEPLVAAEAARWGDASGTSFGVADWEAEVAWVEDEWFPYRAEIVIHQLAIDGLLAIPLLGDATGAYELAVRQSYTSITSANSSIAKDATTEQ